MKHCTIVVVLMATTLVVPLSTGDIVHIPAGIPHRFLVPAGKHLTYVLLKIPAK